MNKYLVRRLLVCLTTLLGITVLIFLAMRVLPGDPVNVLFGAKSFEQLSDADRARFRVSLGLDQPLHRQYLTWMSAVARGDLGESFWRKDKIRDLFLRRGPITAQIALMAMVISWLIGVPLGVSSALKHNSWLDQIIRILNAIFLATPEFLLGLLVVLVGVLYFNWRPPIEVAYLWDRPLLNLQVTLGPAIALGTGSAAYMARMTRSTVLEVMNEDYVRTARAKGLHARLVIWRHIFRNAIVPVITMSGLTLVGLMGSSVAVEMAFATPGLGYTLVKAMGDRDFMVIQNLVLLYGVVCVVANLIVDMACGWLDPRIVYD